MKYFEELQKAMTVISKNKKVIFLGQAVEYKGTAMTETLKFVSKNQKLELPVAEEMQMGMTLGMSLNGMIPVSIYPRWNFLLCSINQLVNHIDKISPMSLGKYKSRIIIRTSVGSQNPLHPHCQHVGNFTKPIQMMCQNLEIIQLKKPKDIVKSYLKALNRKDGKSTLLVEFGDYYNTK